MKIIKIIVLIVFSCIISLIALLFLEIISYFLLSNNVNRLFDVLRLLQEDSVLFWKQKSNLNTEFQNQKVLTNSIGFRCHEIKNKQKFRIVCLGASPTFGWGVKYEDTYPVVLENRLRNNGYDVEVINAGEIGYSSYQGLNLLKTKVLELKPDIITISYVINDIDKYRFFRSSNIPDNQLIPLSKNIVFIDNIVAQSNFVKLIKQYLMKNISKKSQYYGKDYNNEYNDNRRVSLEDYNKNLNEFISIAKEHNIKVFFIVMPVNLPKKEAILEKDKENIDGLFNDFYNLFNESKWIESKECLLKILSIDPYNAKTNYYLGILAEKEKQIELSNEYFEKAKNFEIFDCATISLDFNDIMRQVSIQNNITLCDSAKDFTNYNGDYLFVDPKYDCFHPNAKGHSIIANNIFFKIINYLKRNNA